MDFKFPRYSVIVLLLICTLVTAQERPERDSLYHKIESFSEKSRLSKMLYHLVFRNISDKVSVADTLLYHPERYQGKTIRNIIVQSYDPFGNPFRTKGKEQKWYEKAGNSLHRNSLAFAVRGYLLFKKGEAYDPQKIYESERILRDTKFISRVSILPIDSTLTADSVDVAVRVLDSWSLKPLASFGGGKMGVGISEENFLGYGHEATAYYRTDFKTKQNYYLGSYTANNIYGTYINAKILIERDFEQNENIYFHTSRDFISPLMKWGGGAKVNFYKHRLQIPVSTDTDPRDFPYATLKFNSQDFWAGYQLQLGKNSEGKVTDNLTFAARFRNTVYKEHPPEDMDPGAFFKTNQLYLGSLEYTKRKFAVRKNVFIYDLPEDIPYGAMLSVTSGFMKPDNEKPMPYAGVAGGYGFFTNAGYFNYKVQYGTFFREKENFMSAFRIDGTYFSPLRNFEKFNLRHFLSQTLVVGNRRNISFADRTNFTDRTEFPQLSQNYVGRDKFVLRYQLQFFIKKPWKNFQINPYIATAFGWLAADKAALFSSKANVKIGLGAHFYNPFLAFNRFQISLVYYPRLPFTDRAAFDFNRYKNYYMPLNRFLPSEPSTVRYAD